MVAFHYPSPVVRKVRTRRPIRKQIHTHTCVTRGLKSARHEVATGRRAAVTHRRSAAAQNPAPAATHTTHTGSVEMMCQWSTNARPNTLRTLRHALYAWVPPPSPRACGGCRERRLLLTLLLSQSVSYFTVPPRAHRVALPICVAKIPGVVKTRFWRAPAAAGDENFGIPLPSFPYLPMSIFCASVLISDILFWPYSMSLTTLYAQYPHVPWCARAG